MAAIAHMGVGLAAKRAAPGMPVWILVIGAYFIDIVWGAFWLAGMENFPAPGVSSAAPWSHGLFMALVWSAAAGAAVLLVSRSSRAGLITGLLVFSHWAVDFVAKPMRYSFPSDAGLPLLFEGSPEVGLGVWGTRWGQHIGEYGTLAAGAAVYLLTVLRLKREKVLPAGEKAPAR